MTDTKKLRELLAKGTKPPLEVKTNRAGNPTIGPVGSEGMIAPWIVSEEDAALIVSAVNALPALLDEVEGLRAERDALLNSIPIDLAKHVASLGPAEWGATAAMSADEHGKHVVQSVKITAERFGQTEDQQMHGLCLEGTDTVLCHTGTSPNSPQTSRALAGAWNKLVELCAARAALGETK